MTGDAILDRVHGVVAGIAGPSRSPADAGPDTPLGEGGFWLDSVDMVELIIACESEFDVVFEDVNDLSPQTLATARSLAALIVARGGR